MPTMPQFFNDRPPKQLTQSKNNQHIYANPRHRKLRKIIIATYPICQICNRRASTVAHHIVPIDTGGEPFDLSNYQAVCYSCHEGKHHRLSKKEQIEFDQQYNNQSFTRKVDNLQTLDDLRTNQ